MPFDADRSRTAGFTLIEVLTAVLILSVSLTAIFELFAGATRAASRVRDHGVVLFLAREKMEETLLRKSISSGTRTGVWENGHRWIVEIVEVPAPDAQASLTYSYFSLFDIRVKVEPPPEHLGGSVVLRSRHIARRARSAS
jgi:prepilin-type N-terminal cleavage/methylation domain-containing protein